MSEAHALKLAEKMMYAIAGNWGGRDVEDALPYAEAILKAQEALGALLESPASFEDARIDYAERQVDTREWTEAQSALAALKAITEDK
jgi:thioredoxin-like negative regulator of GroEL